MKSGIEEIVSKLGGNFLNNNLNENMTRIDQINVTIEKMLEDSV